MKIYKITNTSQDSFIEIRKKEMDNTMTICMGRKNILIRKDVKYNNKDFEKLLNEINFSIMNGLSSFEWNDSFQSLSIKMFKDYNYEYCLSACISQLEEDLCVTLNIDKECLEDFLNHSVEDETNDESDWGEPKIVFNSNCIDTKNDDWNVNFEICGETFKFKETRNMSFEFDFTPFIAGLHGLLSHKKDFAFQFCNTAFHLKFVRENNSLYKVYVDYSIDQASSYIESSLSLSGKDILDLYKSLRV